MKRTHLVMMAAIVLTVALLLGAQKPARKWEYAKLRYGVHSKWSWMSPGVSIEGKNVNELVKKLSIETPLKDEGVFEIVDWAGSQGWELIVVDRESTYSVGWFKRPK